MKPWVFFIVPIVAGQLNAAPSRREVGTLEELAKSYEMSKEDLLESEAKKRKILASLYKINRNVKNISKHKTILTDELMITQARIHELSGSIVKLESLTTQQRDKLKRRLRVMYKFSGQGFVKTLFSNSSLPDLDRFLKFMKVISERDFHLIHEYQRDILAYQSQKVKFTKETERLIALKGKIKAQEDRLIDENRNTQKLLALVDSKRLNQLAQLGSLRSKTQSLATSSDRVDAALLKMLEPSFFEQKGVLAWPVTGAIFQGFGYTTDDIYQFRLGHKGLFFKTTATAFVTSCFPGTVAYAGNLEGYGKAVILDHGHHYYTVYGNNSALQVSVGDKVVQNQKIARAGWSDERHQSGLYFEVRHFSEPEDPAVWLKNLGVQILKNGADQI